MSSTIQITAATHGLYLFTAMFDTDASATVIVNDAVVFMWNGRARAAAAMGYNSTATPATFEQVLPVGEHHVLIEYVDGFIEDGGGYAYLGWVRV